MVERYGAHKYNKIKNFIKIERMLRTLLGNMLFTFQLRTLIRHI